MLMGMGPVPANPEPPSERAGLSIGDVDLFELNEAFAAQALAVSRELALDPAGQRQRRRDCARPSDRRQRPRVLTTLVHAAWRNLRRGVAALCISGGMGIAMVIETL
jgi:acetyl-CoA C-acetyltransferase